MDGTTVKRIAIDDITADEAAQQRAEISKEHVANLAEALKNGAKLPPVRLFHDEDADTFWLSRGWHRYYAQKGRGLTHIDAEVIKGTLRDAILDAVGDNAEHDALRRTNADKRKAVTTVLKDPEWAKHTDVEIAKKCAVSSAFVGNVRADLSLNGLMIAVPERVGTRGGTQYPIDTTKIGKSSKAKDEEPEEVAEDTEPEPPKPPPVPLDKEDHPLPDKPAIRHAFAEAEDKFDAAIIGLSHIKGVVSRIPDTTAVRFNRQKTIGEISSARSELSHGRPHSVCPYCGGNPKGTPCQGCNGIGWVTKLTYDEAPRDIKAKLEVR